MSSTTTTTTTKKSNAIPWVELYRPRDLSSVSHQTQIVNTLTNAIKTNRLPHLLLYGPPGTGKTSVALALCRQLYPPCDFKKRVLELNASDERGISVVRDKIKHFASLAVGQSSFANQTPQQREDNKQYPNPPFKIIILDEADTVTPDAQAALRRIIEAHSKITRFILICNYVTRIIEPLASRCAKFRFQSLPPSSMKDRLLQISRDEECKFENDDGNQVIDEILDLSGGDMRRAITTLQSAHSLGGVIRTSSISEMAGLPPQSIIATLLQSLKGTFADMKMAVMDVIAEGYSVPTILSRLLDDLVLKPCDSGADGLDELGRAVLSVKIAETDKNLVDGADEVLQLLSVCSTAMQCLQLAKRKSMSMEG